MGERKINAVSNAKDTEVITNTYSFRSDSAETDVYECSKYLVEQAGFLVADSGQGSENIVYAKDSADEGKVIVTVIDYTESEFIITLKKGEGNLSVAE